MSIFYLFF